MRSPSTPFPSPSARRLSVGKGFTLIELIVVVAILGILGTFVVNALMFELHRDRATAAAQDIAGWLEAVRRSAERGRGCLVTITPAVNATSVTTIATGAIDTDAGGASVINDPNRCKANDALTIESGDNNAGYQIEVDPATSIVFTPRGTIFNPDDGNGAFSNAIEISVNARYFGAAVAPMRCVRITPPLGSIEVVNSTNTTGRCTP